MPELPEVEMYRLLVASTALGRRVTTVVADDRWYLKGPHSPVELTASLLGRTLIGARRRGKLLLVDTDGDGPVLGLRFGMSGRLLVDGHGAIDRLLYSPVGPDPRWDRFALGFSDGGDLRISDPRRLGGVELDPDEERLGPDALTLTSGELAEALAGSRTALKARLLDQTRVAGIGNLLADELLWRAGLAPTKEAGSLSGTELRRLHRELTATIGDLSARGGSHTGDLMVERRVGGRCPRDGAALIRSTVGGRTSWWCPAHQR